jgi:hypothetical protein
MIRAEGPDSLLVIVPAFNEVGAIGRCGALGQSTVFPESRCW